MTDTRYPASNVVKLTPKDPSRKYLQMGREAARECYVPAFRKEIVKLWARGDSYISLKFDCDPKDPLFLNSQNPYYCQGVTEYLRDELEVRVVIRRPTETFPTFRMAICRGWWAAAHMRLYYWLGQWFAVFRD